MNNKFDELTKSLAQSVTRRAALKKFGVGLAGMALACFGVANKARATTITGYCAVAETGGGFLHGGPKWQLTGYCSGPDPRNGACQSIFTADCPIGNGSGKKGASLCGGYLSNRACSFTV